MVHVLTCLFVATFAQAVPVASSESADLSPPVSFDPAQGHNDEEPITRTLSCLSNFETINPQKLRQFRVYLNSPAVPQVDVDSYLDKLALVASLLKQGDIAEARRIVSILSKYTDIDKSLSDELGRKIDSFYEIQNLKMKIEASDAQLKTDAQTSEKTPDQINDEIRHQAQEQEDQKETGSNSETPPRERTPTLPDANTDQSQSVIPPPAGEVPAPEMTQDYLRTLRIQSQIAANDAAKIKLLSQSKQDFELYIKQLFADRHYRHVVLAAAFYQNLYKNSSDGLSPQVSKALEIDRQLSQAISEIPADEGKGQLFGAFRAVYTAYELNSSDPEILGIPPTAKTPIARLLQLLLQLQNALEAQSPPDIEKTLASIRPLAADLNVRPVEQALEVIRRESLLGVDQGKSELEKGNPDEALKDFQKAEKAWPDNPALAGGAFHLFNAEVMRSRDLTQFDELYRLRAFGTIAANSSKFTNDILDDGDRQSKLDQALEYYCEAATARQTAQALRAKGNYAGAWEALQPALSAWPENDELGALQNNLAIKAAPFVAAIQKAQEAEQNKAWGYSLSWYAVAQHDYPASTIARDSIKRLVNASFPK